MSFNNSKNDGYGVKKDKPSAPRSAYEIRTDLLKLAFDMHCANKSISQKMITAEDIINTASSFNDFISKRSD